MKKAKFLFIFLSLALFVPMGCVQGTKNDESLITGQLENGMTYFLYPNAYPKDLVSLRLIVRVGSLMEEENERGLAHFIEHMLFNGTQSFPKDNLIHFLESQGMNFGEDVNAYTSFDSTVYQLDIQKPSIEDGESLKTALEIMREWLRFANFDEEEIEKERGVISQEKLLHEGFSARFSDKFFKVFYPGTLLADRFPIGKSEVIETVSREDFFVFYDKWYRPQRASLVILGDNLNLKELELLIRESFEDLENASESEKIDVQQKEKILMDNLKSLEKPYSENSFELFADKEISSANLYIIQKRIGNQDAHLSYLSRESQIEEAVNWLFHRRIKEILTNSNPLPYQGASRRQDIMAGYLCPRVNLAQSYEVLLFEGNEKKGVHDFFREWVRFWRYGFTEGEFSLYKRTILEKARMAYKNRNKRDSRSLVSSLVSLSLKESILFPSPEEILKETEKFISTITIKDLNDSLRSDLGGEDWFYFYTYNSEINKFLSREEIISLKEKAMEEDLKPYIFEEASNLTGKVFSKVPLPAVSLISPSSNFYSWTLENGIQVYFKPCSFSPREVLMGSTALGLVGLQDSKQWRKVLAANVLVNESGWGELSRSGTDKFLTDKNLSLSTSYDISGRYIKGNFDLDSAEVFFQSLYALLRMPKIDKLACEKFRQNVKEAISEERSNYKIPFLREVKKALYGTNPFNTELQDINLEALESSELFSFYQAQFSNLRDFPLVFVGDIDQEVLVELTARYLGTMELDSSVIADTKDLLQYQDGTFISQIKNDPEDRVTVFLSFTQNDEKTLAKYREEGVVLVQALKLAYERLLTEQVREAISGVYDIAFQSILHEGKEGNIKNRIQIYFVTSPSKIEEVTKEVERVLYQGQTGGFSKEVLDYVCKNLAKTYKDSYRESFYWLDYGLREAVYRGNWEYKDIQSYLEVITSSRLEEIARSLIFWENKKEVQLLPKGSYEGSGEPVGSVSS